MLQPLIETVKSPSSLDSLSNYMGETEFGDLYSVLTQNRDSDVLTRSNFIVALEMLGGESETVQVHRFGHWACGWWEVIAVDKNDTEKFSIAEKIVEDIENYPVLNDVHFSNLEWTELNEYWQSLSLSERVEICRDNDISIFSARYDSMPYKENGEPVISLD